MTEEHVNPDLPAKTWEGGPIELEWFEALVFIFVDEFTHDVISRHAQWLKPMMEAVGMTIPPYKDKGAGLMCEFMKRAVGDHSTGTFLFESMDGVRGNEHDGIWLVRVDPMTVLSEKTVFQEVQVCWEVRRYRSRLRVMDVFLIPHHDRRYYEVPVEGEFRVVDQRVERACKMNETVFEKFASLLPRFKAELVEFLNPWLTYLDFMIEQVIAKQDGVLLKQCTRISVTRAELTLFTGSSKKITVAFVKRIFSDDTTVVIADPPNGNGSPETGDATLPLTWRELIAFHPDDRQEKAIFTEIGTVESIGMVGGNIVITVELKDDFEHEGGEDDPLNMFEVDPVYVVNSLAGKLTPFLVQKKALRRLKLNQFVNPNLDHFIVRKGAARPGVKHVDEQAVMSMLSPGVASNPEQSRAIIEALKMPDVLFIQGPPGTGKSTVMAELIHVAVQHGLRVIACSQMNRAIDVVLDKLAKLIDAREDVSIRPIRLGRESRVTEGGKNFLLKEAAAGWSQRTDARIMAGFFDANPPPSITDVAAWQESVNGIKIELASDPTERSKAYDRDVYLDIVNVVGATCIESGKRTALSGLMGGRRRVDMAIIDEASKCVPPEMIVPMLLAETIIIVGDQKQLPPTYRENVPFDDFDGDGQESRKLREELVKEFGDLVRSDHLDAWWNNLPERFTITFRITYRLPQDILDMCTNQFYPTTPLVCGNPPGFHDHGLAFKLDGKIVNPAGLHLLFIDTGLKRGGKRNRAAFENHSQYNDFDLEVTRHVSSLVLHSKRFTSLSCIAVYGAQAKRLRQFREEVLTKEKVNSRLFKVGTVDSFQGSEADIIILNTVSTDKLSDFFKKQNRINVASSRAVKLLIIIGRRRLLEPATITITTRDGPVFVPVYKNMLHELDMKKGVFDGRDVLRWTLD